MESSTIPWQAPSTAKIYSHLQIQEIATVTGFSSSTAFTFHLQVNAHL